MPERVKMKNAKWGWGCSEKKFEGGGVCRRGKKRQNAGGCEKIEGGEPERVKKTKCGGVAG